jgi:glycine/D-amino acid oxidase-like deaminating enzyme
MNVVIIGCGVIGATIAYELSRVPGLKITVIDQNPPAQASTGAALGVLMGAVSQKIKGKAWQMRSESIQRYETLIPELASLTGREIPFNRQGLLHLCFLGEDMTRWENLVQVRHSQGWQLEIWDRDRVNNFCPQLSCDRITGAVYSPQDRQVDPTALTLALIAAASIRGVTFKFGVGVGGVASSMAKGSEVECQEIETTEGKVTADWFIVAAGLGSALLTAQLKQTVDIRPVLGQAWHLRLGCPFSFQPVITGEDVHIVPVGQSDYWIGATVEFPTAERLVPNPDNLESVRQQAIALCPELAKAEIIRTWSGLRPRPEGRPAPIIGKLPGFSNILLATGHYRNGVLLAPATAQVICEMIST